MAIDIAKLIVYNPTTGCLTWRVRVGPRGQAGSEIGTITAEGYRRVKINGQLYMTHRLAWFLNHGVWPTHEIDHIDGDRLNNRIDNLRDVPKALNQRNARKRKDNSSGLVGVRKVWYPTKYWVAQWFDGKRKNKWFSVNKYGDVQAKQMAVAYRKARVEEIGGYTERHGDSNEWLADRRA